MSKQRTITFRTNKALQEKVIEYCSKKNITFAELIAEAVKEICRKYSNKYKKDEEGKDDKRENSRCETGDVD